MLVEICLLKQASFQKSSVGLSVDVRSCTCIDTEVPKDSGASALQFVVSGAIYGLPGHEVNDTQHVSAK